MPLSKPEVIERMSDRFDLSERLIIEPFFKEDESAKTAPASIDVHLGNRFVFLRRGRSVLQDPLVLSDHAGASDNPEAQGTEVFLPFGTPVFLHPGQLVLGHTLEWIRLPANLTGHVDGRSIWGRRGLIVVTAAAVQPGSAGIITLELANAGEVAVVISPGAAVAQLVLDVVTPTDLMGKRPPFGVGNKPSFGHYRKSRLERALIGGERTRMVGRGGR
jgi:dCTP deaminase